MAPRSPTHAFDPSPALEHNQDNFSPLNSRFADEFSNHTVSRGVHFSDPPISTTARHSIATTTVPFLPSVSSASTIPRQAFRITDHPSGININAYIEQCRSLNEQLRQVHESERKAWDIERTALQARVADLEFKLNMARDPKRRSSNDSSATSAQSFRSDFRTPLYNFTHTNGPPSSRQASDSALCSGPPVWRGPESTPPVTRVFSNDDDVNHLPSISEDEPFPTLSKEVSPTNKGERGSIPVEQIDKTLDGINLRSTGPGVTSSFVAKISSPQFGSPGRSPSPRPPRNTLSTGGSLTVEMNNLLDPLDEKLKRHAGHTPMAFDGALSTSATTTNVPSPKLEQDNPPDPAPTVRPPLRPSENSESYFSTDIVPQTDGAKEDAIAEEAASEAQPPLEAQDDPALVGPLMLDPSAQSQAANTFLDQVDAKLLEAAAHTRERSDTVTTEGSEAVPAPPPVTGAATNGSKTADEQTQSRAAGGEGDKEKTKDFDDEGPVLKIKKSTNFGSAWGAAPTFS